MSYELPCGWCSDLASLDVFDFASLVERLTKGKEILRYGVLSV